MTLVDVIRAAVSQIEDYERVSLSAQPGIAVSGPAVNDVVHLLAELAENAASLSAGRHAGRPSPAARWPAAASWSTSPTRASA